MRAGVAMMPELRAGFMSAGAGPEPMSQTKCSCDKFERLEGASANAYAAAFLEDLGRADPGRQNGLRCRVCGREWEKHAPDAAAGRARPSLVRVK
jgi:hypothetical protein